MGTRVNTLGEIRASTRGGKLRTDFPVAQTPAEKQRGINGRAVRYSLVREILRRMVIGHQAPSEIAGDLGIDVQRVQRYINTPMFRQMQQEAEDGIDAVVRRDTRGILTAAAPHAAEKLVEHSDSQDPAISLKSCMEILDRTGHTKAEKSIVQHTFHLDDEDKQALARAIMSNKMEEANAERNTQTDAESTPEDACSPSPSE